MKTHNVCVSMSSPAKSLEIPRWAESDERGRVSATLERRVHSRTGELLARELRLEFRLGAHATIWMTAIGLEDDENVAALRDALFSKEADALEACLPIAVREVPSDRDTVEIVGSDLDLIMLGDFPSVSVAARVPRALWHEALDDLWQKLYSVINGD